MAADDSSKETKQDSNNEGSEEEAKFKEKTENDQSEEGTKDDHIKKFRLTPEEQEIAYEAKASTSARTYEQNQKLSSELTMHRNLMEMRRKQQERVYSTRTDPDERLSRLNAIKLMRMYERRAKDAELKASILESDLNEAQDLAKRYHNMYLQEKEKSGDRPKSRGKSPRVDQPTSASEQKSKDTNQNRDIQQENHKKEENKDIKAPDRRAKSAKAVSAKGSRNGDPPRRVRTAKDGRSDENKVTEDDLDDDEALFKRHVEMIAETGAMRTTSPIRVTDVIRKSECLIMENEDLKREVKRLQWENSELVKKVKHSLSDRDKLMHSIGTSEMARSELMKRLQQEKLKQQRLTRSLNRQASDWIQYRKDMQESEERRRWAQVGYVSVHGAESRSAAHPAKKNVYKPRCMFPAEQYANPSHTASAGAAR